LIKAVKKRLLQMLAKIEQLVKAIEVFPVAVIITHSNGRIVLVNGGTEAMFGYPRSELLGQLVEILMPERYSEPHARHRSDYSVAPRARLMGFGLELIGRRKNGEEFPIEVGLGPGETDSGTVIIAMVQDITKRREAEEALSSVRHKLIQAHEDERAWIARELHDDIGQRLALLRLDLDRLKTASEASPNEFGNVIGKAKEDVLNLAHDIQALSHRLHSSKLEYFGLAQAAASYCSELCGQYDVDIHLQTEHIPPDLPEDIALCMFRVLQEALQNAIKHSRSRRFDVLFDRAVSDMLCLTVHDSGIGFDPAEAIKGPGLGLVSMRERVKLIGGELSVESQPGKGTTVHGCVPLMRARPASVVG
jgi:PAS domain S-box-containing protein